MRHITRSMTIAAVVAASALGAPAALAAPPTSTPVTYLALGDSYPAGFGVIEARAYPQLLEAARYAEINVQDQATSGATTTDVLTQLATAAPGSDVVTLTVGGNDLDWVNVLLGNPTAIGQLPDRMTALPAAIGGLVMGVAEANPGATILVTGYPHPFGVMAPDALCDVGYVMPGTGIPVPVSGAQAAQANAFVDQLNGLIASTVAATDASPMIDASYVDVVDDFAGHGLCDTNAPWLFDVDDMSTAAPDSAAFHPNARGQKAYAQAIQDTGFRSVALTASRS